VGKIEKLLLANPLAKIDDAKMYLSFYDDYISADKNITEHGTIVQHPRTGSPIENPYLKIKIASANQLKKLHRIKDAACLWND
jgi:phage terminase small subunit